MASTPNTLVLSVLARRRHGHWNTLRSLHTFMSAKPAFEFLTCARPVHFPTLFAPTFPGPSLLIHTALCNAPPWTTRHVRLITKRGTKMRSVSFWDSRASQSARTGLRIVTRRKGQPIDAGPTALHYTLPLSDVTCMPSPRVLGKIPRSLVERVAFRIHRSSS